MLLGLLVSMVIHSLQMISSPLSYLFVDLFSLPCLLSVLSLCPDSWRTTVSKAPLGFSLLPVRCRCTLHHSLIRCELLVPLCLLHPFHLIFHHQLQTFIQFFSSHLGQSIILIYTLQFLPLSDISLLILILKIM